VQLIFDSNGNGQADDFNTLEQEYGYSNSNASISSPLGVGTYFIRVYTDYSSYNTIYTLGLSATTIPYTTPRDPGNILGSALEIGTLSGSRSFGEFVGKTDRNDYYRFSLSSPRNFNLSLDGLGRDADVELILDK